jgi:energy-coupling factor transporter ATP-binding protein EcfA2
LPVIEHTAPRAVAADRGEMVSVLGAPGSGKTRLALELAYLARPLDGTVLFHGENPMKGRSMSNRPQSVTLLVQNAEDQLFARTVFDDVAFGPRRLGLDDEKIEGRVRRALAAVGLGGDDVRERSPFALSGGERRRVALAGVMAMEPEVLILDEPTNNLDPHTREEFVHLLAPLRSTSAVIWLTCNAADASHADRIYLLRDESTVEVRSGDDLMLDWRTLSAAGIELPPEFTLAAALEGRGCELLPAASPAAMRQVIVDQWRSRHAR